MPVAERWAYFDHAAVAPLTAPAAEALRAWADEAVAEGDTVWPEWSRRVEATRDAAAQLIGADRDEIALVPNTTAGISLVAEGLDWRPGDNVVTLADEFPVERLSVAQSGQPRRRDAARADRRTAGSIWTDLAAACDARTRIVSVSWVGYATGYRHDVDRIVEIAHERGALVFLDAIQGLGAFPLDVRETPVDFLAADGHKWMLGPGGGRHRLHSPRASRPAAAVRRRLAQRRPCQRLHADRADLKPTAARYEGGSQNMAGMLALGGQPRTAAGAGHRARSRRPMLDITDRACERLTADRGDDRLRPPAGHRGGSSVGHRGVRAAGPRPDGREEALPDAAGRAELPRRPVADQPACVQQ